MCSPLLSQSIHRRVVSELIAIFMIHFLWYFLVSIMPRGERGTSQHQTYHFLSQHRQQQYHDHWPHQPGHQSPVLLTLWPDDWITIQWVHHEIIEVQHELRSWGWMLTVEQHPNIDKKISSFNPAHHVPWKIEIAKQILQIQFLRGTFVRLCESRWGSDHQAWLIRRFVWIGWMEPDPWTLLQPTRPADACYL